MYQSPKSEPGDNLGLTIDVEVIYDITKRFVSIKLYLQGISRLVFSSMYSSSIHMINLYVTN